MMMQVWEVRLPAAPVRPQPAQGAAASDAVGAHDRGLGAPAAAPTAAAGAAGGGGGYSNCGIHALALSPDGGMLATGGNTPADCQIMRVTRDSSGAAPALEPMQTLVVRHSCSTTFLTLFWQGLIAKGSALLSAGSDWHCQREALHTLSWRVMNNCFKQEGGQRAADGQHQQGTRQQLRADTGEGGCARAQGHNDWVFGITWVTEAHLVTVSRDQRIKLWHVDGSGSPKPNTMPLQSQLPFKVRPGQHPWQSQSGSHAVWRGCRGSGLRQLVFLVP